MFLTKGLKESCCFCGCKNLIEVVQGEVFIPSKKASAIPLYHLICSECGNVVRSFVKEQSKLKIREASLKRGEHTPKN